MEHQNVAVRIGEVRHVAHTRVEDIALENHAPSFQLAARLRDIGSSTITRQTPPSEAG